MKKIVLLLFILFFTGCGTANTNYSGKVTEESKKFLDNGYIVNVSRGVEKLGDDAENYNKGYIRIGYHIITNYVSTNIYDPDARYNIKKKVVSNIRVIKGPKMGNADELYGNYNYYTGDMGTKLLGTNNKFETVYEYPHIGGVQTSILVYINKVALLDANKYTDEEISNLSKVYGDLGINRDSVALTLGFRVELISNDSRTFYKDYEIELPTKDFNLTGSEFHVDLTTYDVTKMEPFLEK